MIHNSVSMDIVIRNTHKAREYRSPINQQTYIEGRDGSEFIIRLTNHNLFRVLVIPSVDGLSIMDGKPAGSDSDGYLLDAGQIMDIPGWKVDGDTAAKFVFSSLKGGSYNEQSGNGDPVNKGVIGLMVFREKTYTNSFTYPAYGLNGLRGFNAGFSSNCLAVDGTISAASIQTGSITGASLNNAMFGSATSNAVSASTAASAAQTYANTASTSASSAQTSASNASTNATIQTSQSVEPMGTAFGDATDFVTKEVAFQKGDLHATLVLFYGSAQFLKTKGIDVAGDKNPNPFPADTKKGCVPPSGWTR